MLCYYCCNHQLASRSICRLQRNDRVPYERYRVEFLHHSPDVVIFHDFITDREATALRNMAVNKVLSLPYLQATASDVNEAYARLSKALTCSKAIAKAWLEQYIFGPGNGSPSATNVVLLGVHCCVVVVIRFAFCYKASSFHNSSSPNSTYI